MKDAGLIERRYLAICLGLNGGYIQIGGHDGEGHVEDVTWVPMLSKSDDFKVGL